ncbi:MAG: hypothetical protein D8H92_11560, partial [Campylobacter sp.]
DALSIEGVFEQTAALWIGRQRAICTQACTPRKQIAKSLSLHIGATLVAKAANLYHSRTNPAP